MRVRRIYLALRVLCVCILIGLPVLGVGPEKVGAQAGEEVPIGTFELNLGSSGEMVPEQSRSRSTQLQDLRPSPQGSLDEPLEELFGDAVAELDSGRAEQAQRLFEKVIALAPTSALAGQARRYLADLYRGPSAARRSSAAIAPPAVSPRSDGASSDADHAPAARVARGPEEEVRVNLGGPVPALLEEQFISEAGDRVFFSLGSAELGGRARGVLAAQARFILRRSDLSAAIEGHADDGSLSVEQHAKLSHARAEVVRNRLIEEGIEPGRLWVVARGRDRRVSACPEPECAAQNRRAVTVLVTTRSSLTGHAPPAGASVRRLEPAGSSDPLTH